MNRIVTMFLLLAVSCLGPIPLAQAQAPLVKKGTYNGMWQGGKMKLTIEKVSGKGTFSGIVHLDKESEWPDLTFTIKGEIGEDDSITIHRVGDEWDQVVKIKKPSGKGRDRAWKGILTGKGTEDKKHFELKMPR